MLLELFPFVILNNVMAFVYAYFFSDFLCFDMSLLLLTVTLRRVSNKHCLLSFFHCRSVLRSSQLWLCCISTHVAISSKHWFAQFSSPDAKAHKVSL